MHCLNEKFISLIIIYLYFYRYFIFLLFLFLLIIFVVVVVVVVVVCLFVYNSDLDSEEEEKKCKKTTKTKGKEKKEKRSMFMQIYARFCMLPFVFITSKRREKNWQKNQNKKTSEQMQIFSTNELKNAFLCKHRGMDNNGWMDGWFGFGKKILKNIFPHKQGDSKRDLESSLAYRYI